ncbi:ADP-ribosylation factor GTPase-activating protein AGD3 [Zea mays]|uniref:ADP-ribosylation factor GTPase-activating protein AGD3 n=2 Tax=Zea mays TaxID=4577 RepID=A0A1D6H0Z3_MAIZE|nr:ADP-ribosylation factor GTPase-activating protein AGD3 [Zea mays]
MSLRFWAQTESGIFCLVLRADPNFDDSPWQSVSPEAKDFVKRLLNKDYRKRMTAAQALSFGNNQELHNARSSFEQARFNLVTSLSHVEATKRYEFLEAVSATMDSHLRYFKQGYELLHQMEPYINQRHTSSQNQHETKKPIDLLRKVDGNNMCADCGASEPDWASLNLGALLCIECSGVHRNLGVHISKVRSLTLDVGVWEPSVINLFQSLGNMFVNSIWEETLPDDNSSADGSDTSQYLSVSKPNLFMRILVYFV